MNIIKKIKKWFEEYKPKKTTNYIEHGCVIKPPFSKKLNRKEKEKLLLRKIKSAMK